MVVDLVVDNPTAQVPVAQCLVALVALAVVHLLLQARVLLIFHKVALVDLAMVLLSQAAVVVVLVQ